jgi:hypothetical protein
MHVPPKKSRRWLLITILIVVVLTLVGFVAYTSYENSQCSFVGCGPVDEPQILGASVTTSSGVSQPVCAVVTEGFVGITCEVTISGGTTGVITMNMTSLGGDSSVQFANYTSGPYVRFTSIPSCPLSPISDYNAPRCTVSGNGTSFRFGYSVAQSLPHPEEVAILTITVTKTCCWP